MPLVGVSVSLEGSALVLQNHLAVFGIDVDGLPIFFADVISLVNVGSFILGTFQF